MTNDIVCIEDVFDVYKFFIAFNHSIVAHGYNPSKVNKFGRARNK